MQCKKCEMVVHKDCLRDSPCPLNHYYRDHKTPPPQTENKNPPSKSAVQTTENNDPVRPMAEALFDFPPENDRELRLKKGDKVEVYQICGEWWFGALDGSNTEGYFPGAYVKKIGDWELDG